jgi:hypothetical protein
MTLFLLTVVLFNRKCSKKLKLPFFPNGRFTAVLAEKSCRELATLVMVKEARLSKEWLREHCRQHDLYMTPRLNTVLYLHHKAGANHNST